MTAVISPLIISAMTREELEAEVRHWRDSARVEACPKCAAMTRAAQGPLIGLGIDLDGTMDKQLQETSREDLEGLAKVHPAAIVRSLIKLWLAAKDAAPKIEPSEVARPPGKFDGLQEVFDKISEDTADQRATLERVLGSAPGVARPTPVVPAAVFYALLDWSGAEPSTSVLARAMDAWGARCGDGCSGCPTCWVKSSAPPESPSPVEIPK